MKHHKCQCDVCKRDAEVYARLQKLPESDRGFWESIYMDLCMAELDRDVNAAVIDGSWPNAADILVKKA